MNDGKRRGKEYLLAGCRRVRLSAFFIGLLGNGRIARNIAMRLVLKNECMVRFSFAAGRDTT